MEKTSSTYLLQTRGFSLLAVSIAVSSKSSMKLFASAEDTGDPIATPSERPQYFSWNVNYVDFMQVVLEAEAQSLWMS